MTARAANQTRKLTGWRRWIVEGTLAVGILASINFWQGAGLLSQETRAPAFTLQDVAGETVALEQFVGKTVLLHFWATWCTACKREFGTLNSIHSNEADDVVLLSVVADGDNPNLEQLVQKSGIRYPVLRGSDELIRRYKVSAFPTTYFIDARGIIAQTTVGITSRWGMNARLFLTERDTTE